MQEGRSLSFKGTFESVAAMATCSFHVFKRFTRGPSTLKDRYQRRIASMIQILLRPNTYLSKSSLFIFSPHFVILSLASFP